MRAANRWDLDGVFPTRDAAESRRRVVLNRRDPATIRTTVVNNSSDTVPDRWELWIYRVVSRP